MSAIPVQALARTISASWRNAGRLEIAGITADSRRVAPGYLFAALPGSRVDGRAFIADAVSRGAVAVLAPAGTAWPPGVPPRPLLEDPEPRRRLAQLAAGLAGSQPRVMVAVTGTNGKTSTVEFLRQLWSSRRKAGSQSRHTRPDRRRVRSWARPDHARSGHVGGDSRAAGACRSSACRDGGLLARPRPVPSRRRAPVRRRVHQSDARSSRLSRLRGRVSCRQAAAVCRVAAAPVPLRSRAARWTRRRWQR